MISILEDAPPEKADEQNDTASVAEAITRVIIHLYDRDHCVGSLSSAASQRTTKGSTPEPLPSYCEFSTSGETELVPESSVQCEVVDVQESFAMTKTRRGKTFLCSTAHTKVQI